MRFRPFSRNLKVAIAVTLMVLSLAVLSASQARAGYVTDTLGAAGPGNFAIFSLGGSNLSTTNDTLNGPGQTTGNVGVASSGSIALNSSSPPAIIGNLFLGNTANTNGSAGNLSAQVSGTIFTNQDAFLGTGSVQSPGFWSGGTVTASGAVADALNAAKTFANLAPNKTLGDITGNTTITSTATGTGTFVVDVGSINENGSGKNLTLSGAAGTQFVLNVSGTITLNGGNNFSGGDILLAGGLTPNDVVINLTSTSTGDNVSAAGGSSPDPNHPGNTLPNAQINGILLDVTGGVGFSPGLVNGEIIGGGNEIRLVSGSQVNGAGGDTGPDIATPAPPSVVLLGLGGLGLMVILSRSRRRLAAA